jgi:hypothetical protein
MKTPLPAPTTNPSFGSTYFAGAQQVEDHQEAGRPDIAINWARLFNKAVDANTDWAAERKRMLNARNAGVFAAIAWHLRRTWKAVNA